MPDATYPPLRMRFSFESRCRIVRRILAGESPSVAAAAGGASRATGYRLWQRYREGGWEALRTVPGRRNGSRGGLRPIVRPRSRLRVRTRRQVRSCLQRPSSGRPRRSARCCVGSASRACPSPSSTRSSATSASVRVSSSTSKRSGSTASGRWARRSSRTAAVAAGARLALPPRRDRQPLATGLRRGAAQKTAKHAPLPRPRARLVPRAGHRRRARHQRTTPAPTAPVPGGSSAPATASVAASPAPIAHKRTGRRRR